MNFKGLVSVIANLHKSFAEHAVRAVNISLTIRNWMIGFCIQQYEQNGADRAQYGHKLFEKLHEQLHEKGELEYHPRELRRCRQFYQMYPQIRGTVSPEFLIFLPEILNVSLPEKRVTLSPESGLSADRLVQSLSFSHFVELIKIEESLKRTFYEIECIKGNWSVRELKRQIASLYYERSGLSKDKKKLAELTQSLAETDTPRHVIRDPYVFEFLGLKQKEVMRESDLEEALLDKLQDFLLELGRGFCFEARQKRILIGDEYFFVDLVFYHRILKCHVLIELKADTFRHEYLGQLNTYLSWYINNETTKTDNPPVGILLCTEKNHALVKYALAGMNNQLFISKYQLQLPDKDEIRKFIEEQLKNG